MLLGPQGGGTWGAVALNSVVLPLVLAGTLGERVSEGGSWVTLEPNTPLPRGLRLREEAGSRPAGPWPSLRMVLHSPPCSLPPGAKSPKRTPERVFWTNTFPVEYLYGINSFMWQVK